MSQFYHSEVEIPGRLEDIISLAEAYIKSITGHLYNKCSDLILQVAGTLEHIEQLLKMDSFPSLEYDSAITELTGIEGALKSVDGRLSITPKGEKHLIQTYGGVVWLRHMDQYLVPFYQAVNSDDPNKANCADLLFGIGEVVGAGERHCMGSDVRKALKRHFVSEKEYDWYITMKERYPLQTSGFGMGVERYLLWLLRHNDIRDCQLLLRQNGIFSVP